MLEFHNLSVTYGKKAVLDGVCFALRHGKITALLGKNGSGKSTLLSCVNRLAAYSGRITLDGKDIVAIPPRLRAREVAIFPQILPDTPFSVRELAALGRNPYVGADGRLSAADRETVTHALDMAGVSHLANRAVNTLSGGERQRAFLAMVLAQDTPSVLLDEPATFLDADAARDLYTLVTDLSRVHQRTVLAVMHDLSAAVDVADDIVILDGGRVAFHGTAEECLASHAIETIFSVKAHVCEDGTVFFR